MTAFAGPEIASFVRSWFGFGMGVAKVARESFRIGAFCSMAGDQDGPIGAVGRDGFFEPQNP